MRLGMRILAPALLAIPAFAQNYEFFAGGGVSFYDSKTVTNTRGNADAGFKTGWGATAAIGNNMYEHVGGEIRYTFQQNDMKLKSGSTEATFGGQSHAIHYDFLIHGTNKSAAVRPYVAFGGGVKQFRGTGTEVPFQPLSNIALLTKTDEIKGMLSVGGGVKISAGRRIGFRLDVHDYITPFPKDVITPNVGSNVSGWLNNIVATAGINIVF